MNDKEMQKKKNAAAITTAGVSGGSTNTSSGDKLASTVSSHGETVSGNSLPTVCKVFICTCHAINYVLACLLARSLACLHVYLYMCCRI